MISKYLSVMSLVLILTLCLDYEFLCVCLCVFIVACIVYWKLDMVYWVRKRGEQTFSVRFYIYLARNWAVFSVCCICGCQRLKFPLVSLVLCLMLPLGFRRDPFLVEPELCCSFRCSSFLLYEISVDVAVDIKGKCSRSLLLCLSLWWACDPSLWSLQALFSCFPTPTLLSWHRKVRGHQSCAFPSTIWEGREK